MSARCAELPGRSLESASDGGPRGMIVLDRIRLTGPVLTICPSLSKEDEGHSIFRVKFFHADLADKRIKDFFLFSDPLFRR